MESLERGRDHFTHQRWSDAHADLAIADAAEPLGSDDLEQLAMASYLIGRHDDATATWARAYRAHLRANEPERAIRCAYWLWFAHLNRGEMAQASGWLTRAHEILATAGRTASSGVTCAYPKRSWECSAANQRSAQAAFAEVIEIADGFDDTDLKVFGRLGRGQCLVYLGEPGAGLALLDEVMVSVTTGDVSPAIAGFAYCAVIDACRDLFDVRRAQEWTVALTRWCETQPDLVPYRGQCLVHRAELMQLHGAWTDAIAEAELAEEWLSQAAAGAVGGRRLLPARRAAPAPRRRSQGGRRVSRGKQVGPDRPARSGPPAVGRRSDRGCCGVDPCRAGRSGGSSEPVQGASRVRRDHVGGGRRPRGAKRSR